MKKLVLCAFSLLSIAAFADAGYVTNVLVRQRWPWSHKVDIEFTVGGTEAVDVECSATWDGRDTPLALTPANGLSGSAFGLKTTQGHLVWDPYAAGVSNTLTGFRVTMSTAAVSDRTYLVIDLTDGSHEFMASEPEGGFGANDAYKTTKMVFRRVPAGTFTAGLTSAQKTACKRVSSSNISFYIDRWASAHSVTLSNDFYLAIYRMTWKQVKNVYGSSAYDTMNVAGLTFTATDLSYKYCRGLTNAANEELNWPVTKYEVTTNSFFGKFRTLTGNRFVIDYPTEVQWERAAHGDSTKIWWDYGEDSITQTEFTNYLASVRGARPAENGGGEQPGLRTPNAYGIYDMIGGGFELCLDAWNDTPSSESLDPVGPVAANGRGYRVAKGGGATDRNVERVGFNVPAQRFGFANATSREGSFGSCALVRPAIHLNSIFDR